MKLKDALLSAAALAAVLSLSACVRTRVNDTDVEPVEPPPPPVLAPTYIPAEIPATRTIDVAIPAPVEAPAPVPAPTPAASGADNVYVVKKGDALSKIAVAHGVKTAELMEANGIKDANKIQAGQRLRLPAHAKPSANPPAAGAAAPAAPAKAASVAADGTYVVKPGDALSKIAAAHGVKTKALMEANGIKDANKIRIGQKLKIPGASAEAAAPAAAPAKEKVAKKAEPKAAPKAEEPAAKAEDKAEAAFEAAAPAEEPKPADFGAQDAMMDYTVQPGDTVESLSNLFVVSKDDIRRANKLEAGQALTPGQRIKIPSAEP
ncbi:MAG: LysM peptidoglycan-binding domain-containing protein [Kiritimatiellae bacterium]|nr:LysM peptidoglycan-binding domain-containing protein [Kiritimatiellia bacterium]